MMKASIATLTVESIIKIGKEARLSLDSSAIMRRALNNALRPIIESRKSYADHQDLIR